MEDRMLGVSYNSNCLPYTKLSNPINSNDRILPITSISDYSERASDLNESSFEEISRKAHEYYYKLERERKEFVKNKIDEFKKVNKREDSMDKIQSEWYKALKFFHNNKANKIRELMKNNPSKYRKIVPEMWENFFIDNEWINLDTKADFMATTTGIKTFRELETIRKEETQIKTSWISVGIAIIALVVSIISIMRGL